MGSRTESNWPDRTPLGGYPALGAVLGGKYRIERVLGSGGMGIVVAARHLELRQTVAIKLLLPKALERPELAARLVREARAAAALKGEHVARVFDVEGPRDGVPYIVMEYFEGQTLASFLKAEGRLEPSQAVDYALQTCEALAEAHALGIVHRDLKPANLYLAKRVGGRPSLRVLDFGISKDLRVDPESATQFNTDSHSFMGSPHYISPEQLLEPAKVDGRADIWSFGVVLYECLAGKLPFQGEVFPKLWDAILRVSPPAFDKELRLPPGLERIVTRCLEKERDARYPNVLELARDLVAFAPERSRASLDVIEAFGAQEPSASISRQSEARELLTSIDMTSTEAPTGQSSPAVRPAEKTELGSHLADGTELSSLPGPETDLGASIPSLLERTVGSGPAPKRSFGAMRWVALAAVALLLGVAGFVVTRSQPPPAAPPTAPAAPAVAAHLPPAAMAVHTLEPGASTLTEGAEPSPAVERRPTAKPKRSNSLPLQRGTPPPATSATAAPTTSATAAPGFRRFE